MKKRTCKRCKGTGKVFEARLNTGGNEYIRIGRRNVPINTGPSVDGQNCPKCNGVGYLI